MKNIKFVNMAFLGDRLVDTAHHLGIHPSLMATAHTPMIEKKLPLSRQVECTACALGRERSAFFGIAKKMGITRVLLEKNNFGEVDASKGESAVKELGFEVDIIDFTNGIETAIKETCRIFDMDKYWENYVKKYKKSLDKAYSLLPSGLNKRILVLLGMVQNDLKKEFLLVEESGGVNDILLDPLGCTNVSEFIEADKIQEDRHDIRVVNSLSGLVEAAPDMIALTCDPSPGLKAINRIIKENPAALNVPAIANHAVFSLPHCCHSEPMELPFVLESWADALSCLN